ncbi:MAG: hypothetical protein PHI12_07770, partial [Dehalococcoidales bacterium]|nr:hypothetical protein [Dehalococcoidales bacterium]
MVTNAKEIGTRVTSPIVNIAAAGVANAAILFTLPALAGVLVGAKSAVIKKVLVDDNGTGGTQIHIGNGVGGAFVALLPGLDLLTALDNIYGEDELPEVESFANITGFVDAVGG